MENQTLPDIDEVTEEDVPHNSGKPDEEVPLEKNSQLPVKAVSPTNGFRIYTPVIIAAAVLLLAVSFFVCWHLFFEKNLKGIWTLDFNAGDEKCSVSFEIADDNTCYFHEGSIIYKGSYKFSQSEDGRDILKMDYTEYGMPAISANFLYSVEGNNISGKTLVLTDMSGLIFNPYTIGDSNGNDPAAMGYEYTEQDGKRYFRLSFRANNSYTTKYDPIENASADDKLTGIWLNTNDDSRHDNTFAFYDDNTFQITYRDLIYKGCYSAKDNKCKFSLVSYTGQTQENELEYKFEGDKLIITIQDVPAEYTKTDSITAFDNGIK